MVMSMTDLRTLSDDALIASVARLAARARETTAELIAHLVVLEERNLHLACGFSSLFGYCRRVLLCSEAAAYDRMQAAHAARAFPVILALLADGSLHLTAVRLLAPHLKDEDHLALLGGALHKSGREVRHLLARWFPQPDVPTLVRRLPDVRRVDTVPAAAAKSTATAAPDSLLPAGEAVAPKPATSPRSIAAPSSPTRTVEPRSPGRVAFHFTGDDEMAALLAEARALLSHAIPNGDAAAIFKRGLHLVVADARRRRTGVAERPRRSGRALPAGSRSVPAVVKRRTWTRDRGQCAFLDRDGRRCEEIRFLEYHHRKPWIVGGPPTVDNIALRCRAHNQYEAKVYFAPIREALDGA